MATEKTNFLFNKAGLTKEHQDELAQMDAKEKAAWKKNADDYEKNGEKWVAERIVKISANQPPPGPVMTPEGGPPPNPVLRASQIENLARKQIQCEFDKRQDDVKKEYEQKVRDYLQIEVGLTISPSSGKSDGKNGKGF